MKRIKDLIGNLGQQKQELMPKNKKVVYLRDELLLPWTQIAVRVGLSAYQCRKLYHETTGKLPRGHAKNPK